MSKLNYLSIIFLFIVNSCNAQNKETIKIKEVWTPLKVYVNDQLIKNDKKTETFTYIYNISSKKDSISYYDISNAALKETTPIIYTLKKNKKTGDQILIIDEKDISDSIIIKFLDESKSITINKHDTYFLNSPYYNELKQKVKQNNNVLDLIDLLDDNLGDYPYQFSYLKRISSNKKYKSKNFKIIRAKTVTNRTQSDLADIWNITYKYDQNNNLTSVIKKSTEDEVGFEKKLLFKKGSEFKYKIFNNVETRYEDNDEITFDIQKNTYNSLQNHFQFGLVKEETSQLKRTLYQKTE